MKYNYLIFLFINITFASMFDQLYSQIGNIHSNGPIVSYNSDRDKFDGNNITKNNPLPTYYDPSPGVGYASDNGMAAQAACFKFTGINKSNQFAKFDLDEALNTSEVEKLLSVSVGLSGGYEGFTASDTFTYLNDHKDSNTSINITYVGKLGYEEQVKYALSSDILNTNGKSVYASGTNKFFRISCGDRLITSWKEGAFVLITVELQFKSEYDKILFQNDFSAGYTELFKLTSSVKSEATKRNFNLSYRVSAYQLGGDPSKLAAVLAGKPATCDQSNIDACSNTINEVGNFFLNVFPTEFTKDADDFWKGVLVPISDYSLSGSLKNYLTLSPPFITDQIERQRETLVQLILKNTFYFDNTSTLINSTFFNSLSDEWKTHYKNLNITSKFNVETLSRPDSQFNIFSDCFYDPLTCDNFFSEKFAALKKSSYDIGAIYNTKYFFNPYPFEIRFNGNDCPIGTTYNYWNCIMITNISKYLPNIGNSCPFGGNSFDGTNCLIISNFSKYNAKLFEFGNLLYMTMPPSVYKSVGCPANWTVNYIGGDSVHCRSGIQVDRDNGGGNIGGPYHWFQYGDAIYVSINDKGRFYINGSSLMYSAPYSQSVNCGLLNQFTTDSWFMCRMTVPIGINDQFYVYLYEDNLIVNPRFSL